MDTGAPRLESALDVAVRVTQFWTKVERGSMESCWPWSGSLNHNGYGYFDLCGKRYMAHELAHALWVGTLRPQGMETCHSCNNPPCCNPLHLRFDSSASNKADAIRADSLMRGERHFMAKLTDADVIEIRRRLILGETGRALAAEYGVQPSVISKVKNFRSWKHASCREDAA